MESVNISYDLTLIEFMKGYFSQKNSGVCEEKLNFVDKILRAISKNPDLNFYYDVIYAKVGKFLLMEKLQQLTVYTVKHCFDHPCIEFKTVISYDCLCKIVNYLDGTDLLCLILAFHFTCKNISND